MSLKPSRQTNRTVSPHDDVSRLGGGAPWLLPPPSLRPPAQQRDHGDQLDAVGDAADRPPQRCSDKEKFHSYPPNKRRQIGRADHDRVTILFSEHRVNKSVQPNERPGSRFLLGVAEEPLLTKFGRSGLDRSVPCSLFGIFWTPRDSMRFHEEIHVISCFFAEPVVRYDE